MKRRLIRILAVFALVLVAAVGIVFFVATTDAGARWTLARIDAALGGNLTWAAAEGTLLGGMRLADVALDDGSSLVQIERLEFAWQPWRLFDGSLVLDSVDLIGLRHQTRVSGAPLTEAALKAMLFELPVAVELRAFRATDVVLTGIDSAMTILDSITGAAALDGSALTLLLDVRQGDTQLMGGLQLTRELALSGTASWQLPYDGQAYAGTLTTGGSLRQPAITHELTQPLRMTSEGTVVTGIFADEAVSFDLRHEFPLQPLTVFAQPDVQLQASVRTAGTPEQVDIDGTAHTEVPAVAPLDLGFALTYRDSALAIDDATLASTQIGLQGSGLLELEPLALRFDWNLDALNAGEQFPQMQLEGVSGTGSLQLAAIDGAIAGALDLNALAGTLNGYPLSIDGLVSAPGDGSATVELNAANGANTFDVAGTVSSELALAWNLQAPELGTLWQGLSGELQGSGNVSGSVDAPEVNGTLNGGLRLERDADVLELQSLALEADYAAEGNAVNLVLGGFTRTVDGMASLLLLERGEIALTGTPLAHELRASLTAPEDSVQLSLQGAAADGNWSGTLQDVTLDSRAGGWRLDAPAALAYTAGAWTVAENCWSYLDMRVCLQGGKPAGQGIDAELALTALPLAWLNPAAEAPASKPAALQQLQDAYAAQLPGGVRVEGELDAQVSVSNFIDGQWTSLDAVLQPRDLVAQITQQMEEGDEAVPLVQRFGLDVTRAELHSGGGSWAGAIDLGVRHEGVTRETAGTSEAQGTLRGSGELSADGSISGSADFAFGDMGWLEFIAPDVRSPAGVFNGTIGVSGTRARPQLQANMELNNGSFDLPLYGLNIREASFELATDAGNVLRLIGSAQSGEGLLQVSAEVSDPLQAERSIMAEVNGTDFLAFSTDAATVKISPQLSGSFADDLLTVNGSVEIADTEVDLEEVFGAGGDNAVSVSRDVVIVSGEQGSATTTQDEALSVAANIDIRLGENVHVSGYDLDADLNGQLRVEQAPGRPLLVYGELGIPEGRYEIYNQELNARDGRLVFFGNPANPMVDVRAFRETESGEVGVLLTGNLDAIQGRLYSTPTLPEREILSLLVTGKSSSSTNAEDGDAILGAVASFGIGRGEGFTQRVGDSLGLDTLTVDSGSTLEDSALGLGKYLTPDLLMRYKLGLFDRQSVLGIEYSLSERLKLEVETGISQSVDLNYTIEKD